MPDGSDAEDDDDGTWLQRWNLFVDIPLDVSEKTYLYLYEGDIMRVGPALPSSKDKTSPLRMGAGARGLSSSFSSSSSSSRNEQWYRIQASTGSIAPVARATLFQELKPPTPQQTSAPPSQ